MNAVIATDLNGEAVAVRKIAGWIALSLALHAALLLWSPAWRDSEKPQLPSMTVFLRAAPQQPAPATAEPPPAPRITTPPRAAIKPAPPPREKPELKTELPAPVIALSKPESAAPARAIAPPIPPPAMEPPQAPPLDPTPPRAATPPAIDGDFAALVDARRRARGDSNDAAPSGAVASAALKPNAPLAIESKRPTANSGWFRIDRKGIDYADYMFFGWNENFRSHGLQTIEVRKGDNRDIDIAIIRSVIGVIRRYENGDFHWHSKRLGKTLILSARARDNAGLEAFMLKEFEDQLHGLR